MRTPRPCRVRMLSTVSSHLRPMRSIEATTNVSPVWNWPSNLCHPARVFVPVAPETAVRCGVQRLSNRRRRAGHHDRAMWRNPRPSSDACRHYPTCSGVGAGGRRVRFPPALARECRHIHRHSRESGNPKAIGSKCVFASYRIPGSRFRGDDGNRRLETDILKLTTLPRFLLSVIGSLAEPT